jgi:hypothetical protein
VLFEGRVINCPLLVQFIAGTPKGDSERHDVNICFVMTLGAVCKHVPCQTQLETVACLHTSPGSINRPRSLASNRVNNGTYNKKMA